MKRKEIRELLQELPGWEASSTKNSHVRLTHSESGRIVIQPGSSSDWRQRKNTIATCRRIERELAQRSGA